MRTTASTSRNTKAAPRPTGQASASSTPSPVAADLPPVKPSHSERLCPSSTASPHRQTAHATPSAGTPSQG